MRGRRAGIAVLVAVAFAGCGGSSGPGLTSGQRSGLVAQLEAVKVAAAAKDVAGATGAIRRFRVCVARLQRSGALTASQARALRLGALRILGRVKRDNAPPPTPQQPVVTQTVPTPAPTPVPPGHAKKQKHGEKSKEHGKGHGKGEH